MKPAPLFRKLALWIFSGTLLLANAVPAALAHEAQFPILRKPKLIVLLVFDQFRADYLTRFQDRFLPAVQKSGKPGGFRWLISHGAYYPFAEYEILQSMTGPGHATILTGSYPYLSGVPINDWYDRATRSRMYCAEDSSVETVGATPKDPHVGTSPKNLIATTLGDELKDAGYPSRVVSISLKDRAAIFMGGHRADLALWFDKDSYRWVSSRYYLKDGKLPGWVSDLNGDIAGEKGKALVWKRGEGTGLTVEGKGSGSPDPFPQETRVGEISALATPYGLTLTERAVARALQNYKLGKGTAPDLLAISFSSHDYAGHHYGPNHRVMEEMTVADDRIVADILADLKKQVGLEDVAIVLTADHGIPPQADFAHERGLDAARIDQKQLTQKLEAALDKKFGKPNTPWFGLNWEFNFHFDPAALKDRGVKTSDVDPVVKEVLLKEPWVLYAFTREDFLNRKLPPEMLEHQILKTYFLNRSGDVVIIPRPFYMVSGDAVTHMTGYSYDRTVPLILTGRFFKSAVFPSGAHIVDIAPTLSFLTGTVAPSLSEGRVLSEALEPGQLSSKPSLKSGSVH